MSRVAKKTSAKKKAAAKVSGSHSYKKNGGQAIMCGYPAAKLATMKKKLGINSNAAVARQALDLLGEVTEKGDVNVKLKKVSHVALEVS